MQFIKNVKKEEYIKFVNNHSKSHFLQSYAWGQFCEKAKGQIANYIGMADDNGELVAASLILEKKTPLGYSYGYSPRGFITDYHNKEIIKKFTNYLKQYMKDKKMIYIKFDPDIPYQEIDSNANPVVGGQNNYELYNYMLSLGYHHTGFYRLYEGNQPRYTFRIDLKKDWNEIEKRISKSFIKSIKRSETYDLEINNDQNVEVFYKLMQNNSKKDHFDSKSLKYYEIFTKELSKENIVKYFNVIIKPKELIKKIDINILQTKKEIENNKKRIEDLKNQLTRLEKDRDIFANINEDSEIICSLICTYTNNRAWSLFIGSNDIANYTFAVSKCYYEAIKDAYNNGYDFFDLFGTPGDPNTNYKNLASLHDFKRKFGDQYIEFIGEFDLINKKILYKILPILLKIYRRLRRLKK